MIVIALVLLGAVGLGIGVASDNETFVVVALASSLLAIFMVLFSRVSSNLRIERAEAANVRPAATPGGSKSVKTRDRHSAVQPGAEHVVFMAGRTTYHRPDCGLIAGKPRSSALRAELESGGMSACRRCMSS